MNTDLPIYPFKNKIIETVRDNQAIIITAETGAGKSTQVVQYLLESGYSMLITQPRRIAARTVAARVAEENQTPLGTTIGYRTAIEQLDSPATQCLFCTDGLALVRELMGVGQHDILIIDEIHELNMNIETLLAWSLYHIKNRPLFKVVLMSATIEAEKLSNYFLNAPIIEVPGRTFPIEERKAGAFFEDIIDLVQKNRNVLVFQPGKSEIEETIRFLEDEAVDAEILPLHGDLTPEEQALCFQSYSRPKIIVSTNIAQTSITVPDIDAVVDSGLEKRIELSDGVEGLYLRPISKSDSQQRKGRAGRVKPGIYIDHNKVSNRPEFPIAEILRRRLDQTVLRLAEANFDMEELPFFHQPKLSEIKDAKRVLKVLNCFDQKGNVTKLGQDVALLPLNVRFARMIVEADKLGVVEDIVTIASILEAGDICQRRNQTWRRFIRGERKSDVFAQIALFDSAHNMTEEERFNNGIHEKTYKKAVEIRDHLKEIVQNRVSNFTSSHNREDITKAMLSGMVDCLYRNDNGRYVNVGENNDEDDYYNENARSICYESVVHSAEWVVGLPFDISTNKGTIKLLRMVTEVDPYSIVKFAKHLLKKKPNPKIKYDSEQDQCISETRVFFNNLELEPEIQICTDKNKASLVFAEWVTDQIMNGFDLLNSNRDIFTSLIHIAKNNLKEARKLQTRSNTPFECLKRQGLIKIIHNRLNGATTTTEAITQSQVFHESFVDPEITQQIEEKFPASIDLLEHKWPIIYEGSNVSVFLKWENICDHWQDLPNQLIRPNGLPIKVSVKIKNEIIHGKTIKLFKEKINNYFNKNKIELLKNKSKEELPDLLVDETIPQITKEEYGTCNLSGETLIAYKALQVYYNNKLVWKWSWHHDEAEAIKTINKSNHTLKIYRFVQNYQNNKFLVLPKEKKKKFKQWGTFSHLSSLLGNRWHSIKQFMIEQNLMDHDVLPAIDTIALLPTPKAISLGLAAYTILDKEDLVAVWNLQKTQLFFQEHATHLSK